LSRLPKVAGYSLMIGPVNASILMFSRGESTEYNDCNSLNHGL
jgi:hypothetical protein